MYNNAQFGFMVQNSICKKFNIKFVPKQTQHTFESNMEVRLEEYIDGIINDIFARIKLKPIKCTTFDKDEYGKAIPYNFVLSDNSTLSVRTNFSGDKVAPRIVGQAGFEKLNIYFSEIYGKPICTQDDIKIMFMEKVEKLIPIFVEKLLDADHILWIYQEKNEFSYDLIEGDLLDALEYNRENFSFTRDYSEWNESTTLKYKGKSLAEIQVHKNRSFKFRFIMKNLIPLLKSKNKTNETLGITAEKVICDMFKLEYPANFFSRYSVEMQYQLQEVIMQAFEYLPRPVSHTGSETGDRGGNSKCSYDFMLYGDKTLSLKTNIGKMVCPPEVGQPNDKTCYLYFKDLVNDDHIDKVNFKKMVYQNVDKMIPIYLEHMFDSDYLLRLVENKDNRCTTPYCYEIYPKNYGSQFKWNKDLFAFSKPTIDEWNESNTLYYEGVSIGEFQVHNHRNCFKFRFNFSNLTKIMKR